MANVSDAILDSITGHSVDLLRVDASIRKKITKQLKALEKSLVQELEKAALDEITRTPYKMKRLQKLLEVTKKTIKSAYKGIDKDLTGELAGLAEVSELQAVDAINKAIEVDVLSVGMSQEMMESIVSESLIQGAPSAEWWSRQADNLQIRFKDTVREGMLRGDTTPEIVRKIRGTRARKYKDGIMDMTRRQAESVVRTSVQTVANNARKATYQNNDDIVKGVEWVSTLDGRTSTICRAYDGLQWDMDNKPVGHNKELKGPPAHWSCRSTLTPVLRSWKELGAKGKFKEIPESTRASMDGQVSAGLTYEGWLKKKPEAFQIGVLGRAKYDLWKAGKVSFVDLVDQRGNELSVEELKQKFGIAPRVKAKAAAGRTEILGGSVKVPKNRDRFEAELSKVAPSLKPAIKKAGLPELVVSDGNQGYYQRATKKVVANPDDRLGSVVRHEYGHHVDYEIGEKVTGGGFSAISHTDKKFLAAFNEDRKNLGLHRSKTKFDSMQRLRDVFYDKSITVLSSGTRIPSYEIKDIQMTGASDIVDALTFGQFQKNYGGYGHGVSYYKDKNMRYKEVFANMFAMRGTEHWDLVKKEFPNMASRFDEIIKEFVDG